MTIRPRLLAAHNPVMGTANILLITLPDPWQVFAGPYAPEVDRWSEHQGRRWMSQGQAAYRLVAPDPHVSGAIRELELVITALPGYAGVHALRHGFRMVRRGFLPRRELTALQVEMDCPETARRVRVNLCPVLRKGSPAAEQDDLEEMLAALLAGIQCH